MKHNSIRKGSQLIKPISLNIRNSIKFTSPKQNSGNSNVINKAINPPNPYNKNVTEKNEEKNVIHMKQCKVKCQFSNEDEHRLKYVQKCLMQALKSGHKLSEYQLKANTQIIRKLKSVVNQMNKDKDKDRIKIINCKLTQKHNNNKQNNQRLSCGAVEKYRNKNQHFQKQRKKQMIKQSYFANNNSSVNSHLKSYNYNQVYQQDQNPVTSGQQIQNSSQSIFKCRPSRYKSKCKFTQKKLIQIEQFGKSARQRSQQKKSQKQMKYCKRILRTNENYLINTKINSNVLTNRDKNRQTDKSGIRNTDSQSQNIVQSQNQSCSSRLSKKIIKINNKPHVIIMKTINNNYSYGGKINKNQEQNDSELVSKKAYQSKISKTFRNDIKSLQQEKQAIVLRQQDQKDQRENIQNNKQKIKAICAEIDRLKQQCQQKDQALMKYQQKANKMKEQNQDLLKRIEQGCQPINVDLKISLKYIQPSFQPHNKIDAQQRLSCVNRLKQETNQIQSQISVKDCQNCQKKQQKAQYLQQKVIDLQMILISQNNQIQSLRKTLSDYIIQQSNNFNLDKNLYYNQQKAKSTLSSQGKLKTKKYKGSY